MNQKDFCIKKITASDTRLLRQIILRPHQKAEDLIYQGDDDRDTIHFGAFYEDELVGIVSLFKETLKGSSEENSWRFRGMATAEKVRGMGFGMRLMNNCIEHVKSNNAKMLWCSARTTAEKFYDKFGMKRTGDVFYPEGLGAHIIMLIKFEN